MPPVHAATQVVPTSCEGRTHGVQSIKGNMKRSKPLKEGKRGMLLTMEKNGEIFLKHS